MCPVQWATLYDRTSKCVLCSGSLCTIHLGLSFSWEMWFVACVICSVVRMLFLSLAACGMNVHRMCMTEGIATCDCWSGRGKGEVSESEFREGRRGEEKGKGGGGEGVMG